MIKQKVEGLIMKNYRSLAADWTETRNGITHKDAIYEGILPWFVEETQN